MRKSIRKTISSILALALCMTGTGLLPAIAEESEKSEANALPLGTYEVENFEGAELWTSIYETQLPDYSGEGFAYLTASPISFNIDVEEEGMYEVKVRACQILSEEGRMQTISVNGIDYTYNMPYIDSWKEVSFGVFRMKEGINEIVLKPTYGYAAYDTITVEKAVLPEVLGTDESCDPKATPEVRSLLKYLKSVYGKHVLSGQQEIYGGGHNVSTNIRYDAGTDTCTDGAKTYRIVEGDYGTDDSGNQFPWHCVDEETGQEYTYNTQNHNYTYNDYDQECNYLYELTGKYPAIRGFDLNTHNPGFEWEDGVADRMISWTKDKNGIVTLSWHCTVPTSMADFEVDEEGNFTKISDDWQKFTYSEKTDFVTANVMIEGTKEYYFYQECMRLAAVELKKLQDAGVPVIFRPLHEAEGNPGNNGDGSGAWFWWAKEGCEVYKDLWKLLYTTLTEEYGLHNLIWEQNLYAWSDESALWYAGDDMVDIVGFDKYNTQYNRHDGKQSGPNEDAESKIFWSLLNYVDNKKMVSMPENDSIPSVENMMVEQAKWLYFCTWYDDQGSEFISGEQYQDPETLKRTYQSEYCITLDELPKDLFKSEGDVTPSETTEPDTTESNKPVPPTGLLYGDADCDGEVSILDVVLMNRVYVGIDSLEDQGMVNADLDLDSKITLSDSMNVLRLLVHLLTPEDFPIQAES